MLCSICSSHSDIAGSDKLMFCVCGTFSRLEAVGQWLTEFEVLA